MRVYEIARTVSGRALFVLLIAAFTVFAVLGAVSDQPRPPTLELCDPDFPEALADLTIPRDKPYSDTVQLRMTLPCKHLKEEYRGPFSFYPIDYRTGNPAIETLNAERPELVSLTARVSPYQPGFEAHKPWKSFPSSGEERYGLAYHPLAVPGRPENHWQVAYFKKGVSGEDFHIICRPETPGFSFAPQEWCTMELQLNPTTIRERQWSAQINIGFRVERLADWPKIEATARKVFANIVVQ